MKILALIRLFLTLGVIVGPLPNNIANGQTIDAVPVMADLNWIVAQVNAGAAPLAGTAQVGVTNNFTASQTFSGGINMSSALNEAAEVSVASATPNIGAAASNNILITGVTTITAFDTVAAGITRTCRMQGIVTLTNSAGLILPGGANILTAAGDCFEAESLGAGNWVVRLYQTASGQPVIGTAITTPGAINHGLAAPTFGSGIMTVSIKNAAGNDPTAASPIDLYFQSPTVTTGTVTRNQVKAAASVVVPATATLGTVSAFPSRIYIGYLWDGTHLEPCCWNSTTKDANGGVLGLFSVDKGAVYSTTILNGASTNAGVIYSATARTGARILPIGYIDSVQTVAGTWAQNADKVTIIGPSTPTTGQTLQATVVPITAATFSVTSVTMVDVTGFTGNITPASKSNLVEVGVVATIGSQSTSTETGMLLVRGSTPILVGATAGSKISVSASVMGNSSAKIGTTTFGGIDAPGAVTSTTYKLQMASDTAGTTAYLNRSFTDTDTNAFYRGYSQLTLKEICA